MTAASTAAYNFRAQAALPYSVRKSRKAQKSRGFRAKSTYAHCIKDKVLLDPPYNTGNDFIYNDNFYMTNEEYANKSGEFDENGKYMFKNTDSDVLFHFDWCSMVYSRLLLARIQTGKAVNLVMVYSYFEVGKRIVQEEQNGNARAAYGTHMLNDFSDYLTRTFGQGFSVGTLKNIRHFYQVYSKDQIGETVFSQSENLPTVSTGRKFYLSWSHYLKLMRIENVDERHFYEIEAAKNNWSLSELNRQFDSGLYERFALSTDQEGIERLSKNGQIIENPSEVVKDPYVLEFLGLDEKTIYSENDLETYLIDNLQRVDLVFYNRLMQCFVLFDL